MEQKIVIVEIINELLSRAGAEVFFVDLCCELKRNANVELYVLTLYNGINESFKEKFDKNGIKVISLGKKKHIDFKSARKMREIISKINPDIINSHLNIMSSYFLAFGLKRHSWNLVHTVHNLADKETDIVSKVLRPFYLRMNYLSFVGISDVISASIQNIYKKAPIKTIYNGIDLKKNVNSEKKYDFICVARFAPQKNHELLLKAFDQFNDKYPNSTLLCVGGGEQYDKYLSFKNTLKSNKNIFFTKPVNNIYNLLSKSRIFILTSNYEGNPISILEAMNAGLPIIASKVGGIPDVVKQNENGLLFEANNLEELLKNMEKIFNNKELIEKIEFNNRSRIMLFDIKNTAREYLEYFHSVIKKGE